MLRAVAELDAVRVMGPPAWLHAAQAGVDEVRDALRELGYEGDL